METKRENDEMTSNVIDPLFPDWFAIAMHLGMSGVLHMTQPGQTVYHYTDLNAFMSILESRQFWVSNINFLNDSEEFEDGRKRCLRYLEEKINTGDSEFREFYTKLFYAIKNQQSSWLEHFNSKEIYALSFCESGDLLTQWQVYGDISIGFSQTSASITKGTRLRGEREQESQKEQRGQYFSLYKVIYEESEKNNLIKQIISYGEKFIKTYQDSVDLCVDGICETLFYFFPLMKNASFRHEKECRMYVFNNKKEPYHISFRQRGSIILPYIKFEITNFEGSAYERLPIVDIFVAPSANQEKTAESIKYYLQHQGLGYLSDCVRCSDIPYRMV